MANLYELEARLIPLLLKNNQFRRKVKKIRQNGIIVGTIGKITLGNISHLMVSSPSVNPLLSQRSGLHPTVILRSSFG